MCEPTKVNKKTAGTDRVLEKINEKSASFSRRGVLDAVFQKKYNNDEYAEDEKRKPSGDGKSVRKRTWKSASRLPQKRRPRHR